MRILATPLLVPLAVLLCQAAVARTFHLDSSSGEDTNDGTSAATPWKSLARAGAFQFQPGDTLLLKRGA